jgi:hypothetical protein
MADLHDRIRAYYHQRIDEVYDQGESGYKAMPYVFSEMVGMFGDELKGLGHDDPLEALHAVMNTPHEMTTIFVMTVLALTGESMFPGISVFLTMDDAKRSVAMEFPDPLVWHDISELPDEQGVPRHERVWFDDTKYGRRFVITPTSLPVGVS